MTAAEDHGMCEQLDAYVDGELAGEAREAYEAHLATCEVCGEELPRLLALTAALDGVRAAPRLGVLDGGAPRGRDAVPRALDAAAPRAAQRRRPWAWVAGGALAAAAGLAFWLTRPAPAPQVASLAGELAPHRSLEPRLSYPGADGYRARDVARGQDSHEHISFERLDALEKQHDWHGLAAAALLVGEPTRAAEWFARAGGAAEVDSDRAALELLDGSDAAAERALENADRALEKQPASGPARWNRALALAALDLPLAAASDFDRVAELQEQGWASEAHERAAALRAQVAQRRTRWKAANEAGARLLKDGTAVPVDLLSVTGYMTIMLYDAVRAAPSAQRVRALLPMAEALDRTYRSDRLAAYVRRIAGADFGVRKPLAETYGHLINGEDIPDAAYRALVTQLDRGAADDIKLGLMVRTGDVASRLDDYRRLATASGDPWFALIAEQQVAQAEIARGAHAAAEQRLRDAISLAHRERLTYRAILLGSALETLLVHERQLAQAHREAMSAHREAAAAGELVGQMNLLNDLAAINQDRYAYSLTRAYLAELLEATDSSAAIGPSSFDTARLCPTRTYAYDSLANISLLRAEVDRARSELARVPRCEGTGETLDALAVRATLVRTELYRYTHREDDGRVARTSLAELKARASLSDAQRAIIAYLEGDLAIDGDRATGERFLRDAIARAERLPANLDERVKVRAYAFSLLALAAGRASEFAKVVGVLAETLGVAQPDRCALAIAVQGTQSVVAFVDGRGEAGGAYATTPLTPALDASTLVPPAVTQRLRSCARVSVLTRAPVLGAARLLPPDVAWSYVLKHDAHDAAATSNGRRVVVANPALPASLKLPPLRPYVDERGDATVLRGTEATPTRVLEAMRDAAVIELHTHGFIANDVSEASYLVLAPDVDQQYAMTANDVAHTKLARAPLVILGACHAAASSRSLEGGMGLAEAFLQSGARAVIASPEAIQDLGAQELFSAVRERVLAGTPPAVALRDERVRRLALPKPDAWVTSIVVFE